MSDYETLKALIRGEGIGRILMDREIARRVRVHGHVLDVGGKGEHSYRARLDIDGTASGRESGRPLVLDIELDPTVDVVASATALPFPSDSFDVVLCFNVLEHVWDYRAALEGMRRLLRRGGHLYLRVPFLMNVHADPHDYWRYTRSSLDRLLRETGFSEIEITAHGGLILVFLNLLGPIWRRIGPLRLIMAPAALMLDRLASELIGSKTYRERYPLGYFVSVSRKG